MKKLKMALVLGVFSCVGFSTLATASTCNQLQDDYNLIYASKGFCFKDPAAIAKYGNDNCHTTKPKFSDKEQQRLDQIQEQQKTLNCK